MPGRPTSQCKQQRVGCRGQCHTLVRVSEGVSSIARPKQCAALHNASTSDMSCICRGRSNRQPWHAMVTASCGTGLSCWDKSKKASAAACWQWNGSTKKPRNGGHCQLTAQVEPPARVFSRLCSCGRSFPQAACTVYSFQVQFMLQTLPLSLHEPSQLG